MRLSSEGRDIASGDRPGGQVRGLLTVLAGHKLSPSTNTYEALQNEFLNFDRLVYLRDTNTIVISVAFNHDGSRAITGNEDGTLQFWDPESDQSIGSPIKAHDDFVSCVAFSPDGTKILSGSADKTFRLWDASTGQPIGQPLNADDQVNSVAFSPDGSIIVSGTVDALRLWNTTTDKPVGKSSSVQDPGINSLAFSPDGSYIVTGNNDWTVRLWNTKTAEPISPPLIGHEEGHIHGVPLTGEKNLGWSGVVSVAFSPTGDIFATGGTDNTVILWDIKTSKPIGNPLRGHEFAVYTLAFSPDGKYLASGSHDKTIRIRDIKTRKLFGVPIKGHEAGILSIAYNKDGSRLISSSSDRTIRLWNSSNLYSNNAEWIVDGPKETIKHIAFSKGGSNIVTFSEDRNHPKALWNIKNGRPVELSLTDKNQDNVVAGEDFPEHVLAVSPDGTRGIQVNDENADTLRLIDLTSKTKKILLEKKVLAEGDLILSADFSPDRRRIVVAAGEKLLILDANTGNLVYSPLIGNQNESFYNLKYSKDGKWLISGGGISYPYSSDGILRLWDAQTLKPFGNPWKVKTIPYLPLRLIHVAHTWHGVAQTIKLEIGEFSRVG